MAYKKINVYTYVSNKVNYKELNYENFLQQHRPWDMESILELIKEWDKKFLYKYFEFRQKIVDIALDNWKKIPSKQLSTWSEVLDCDSNSIFLFTDDDDLYSPDLINSLLNVKDIFSYDMIYWDSCEFITSVMYPNEELPSQPWFNFKQKRKLHSNNFAMTKKGILKLQEEDFKTSQSVNDHIYFLNSIHIKKNLNVGNKTICSISCLRNIKNIKNILDIHKNIKKVNIPLCICWAKPFIEKTIGLYYENKNKHYIL